MQWCAIPAEYGDFAETAALFSPGQWPAMGLPTGAEDPVGIAQRILVLRGQRVLLDDDLAELYGVRTERLNQQVRRNRKRFPGDFVIFTQINELPRNLLQNARGTRKQADRIYSQSGS
jgi:hypothetical protein